MKISIIGGGFTGCLMAIYAAQKKHAVTLFESSTKLGGVLSDIECNGRYFYNGCQYLRSSALESIGLRSDIVQFPHEYGAVTALGNRETRVLNDCAQPALDGKAFVSNEGPIDQSALKRLQSYGNNAHRLTQWASRFGDLSKLDWRCLIPMQVSRIYFPEDPNLNSLKSQSDRANQLTAIPRRLRQPGQEVEAAWLPPLGFNAFFNDVEKLMNKLGVEVNIGTPVKPLISNGHLQISCRKTEYSPDWTIWTNNPTSLLKKTCGICLTTPPVRMRLLFGELVKVNTLPYPTPYYWQIFDETSNLVRLYIYEMQGALRFTAEAFNTGDESSSWSNLDRLIQQLELGSVQQRCGVIEQLRHVNFSQKEYHEIENATPTLLQLGVIPGGWQIYGREEKFASVKKMFDEHVQI